jgi:nucleoside-triphosphatase THEP1
MNKVRTFQPASQVFILTGKVQGGKSTLVEAVIQELRGAGLRIAGVVSRGIDREGKRQGYRLVNIESMETCPLASLDPVKDWFQFRRFFFNPAAIGLGRTWLEEGLLGSADLLLIDEVGPMELQGGGWAPFLEKLADRKNTPSQLWVVREQILTEVIEKWALNNGKVMRMEQVTCRSVVENMLPKLLDHA